WHDIVARHHQRFASARPIRAALFQHCGELGPGFRRAVLAAKFAFAVAPAAVRNHGGEARISAAGVDGDRATEARTDCAYAVRIDRRMGSEKIERIAEILNLFEADDAAEFALALAAAAHIEAQRDIAGLVEHARRRLHV